MDHAMEEWWSLTDSRLRRIFAKCDADDDGRLPFATLREALRRYDLGDVVESESCETRAPDAEVDVEEFVEAARKLMVDKVYARGRVVALVDFSESECAVTEAFELPRDTMRSLRPPWATTRWIEIRGDVTALKLIGIKYALHPLALEDALRRDQRPKEERFETHTQIIVPRFVVSELGPRVRTENVALFITHKSDTLITFTHSTATNPPWAKRVRSELGKSFTKLREEGACFLAYRVLDAVLDSGAPAVRALREAVGRQRAKLRATDYQHAAGEALRPLKADLEMLQRVCRPLARVLATLINDDDVVDHRYNNYIEDAQENVEELIDDITSGLVDIDQLVDETDTYFQRKQDKTIYALTVVTVIFLPMQFISGVYGMNFQHMPELREKDAYPIFWASLFLYTVIVVLALFWCGIGSRRGGIDLPPGGDIELGEQMGEL